MKQLFAVAAAALAFAAAAPAWSETQAAPAAPTAPPAAEVELGVQVADHMLAPFGMREKLLETALQFEARACGNQPPKACSDLFRAIAGEEIDAGIVQAKRILARHFAERLSLVELQDGVAFLRTPGVAQAIMDAAEGKSTIDKDPALKATFDRFLGTPAGPRFLEQVGAVFDTETESRAVFAEMMPRILSRTQEKWREAGGKGA